MAKVACTHCHLTFDETAMITEQEGDRTLYFCCKGCQGVYHLLRSEGLDSFYDKLGDRTLHPATPRFDDLEKFDLEGFKQKYVQTTPEGLFEIHLIIEGIHCAACVWLNEKVLHKTSGIIEATINYSNHKAKVVWDPDEITLSRIIEAIRSIGYNAYPYDAALQEERMVRMRKSHYSRILVAVFGSMNIMWLAIAKYAGYFSGMTQEHKDIINVAEFILATPVLFYSGWVFFRGAFYGLKHRFINMDVLVALGATLTYLYSIYAMVTHRGETYFDSVAMIITFILAGKYLEVLSQKHAVDTLDSLMGATPTEVTVVKEGEKALIGIENVRSGDIIELKPGEKVVIDGIVTTGEASFDESSITGESLPVTKHPGDEVRSGSICLDATVRYEATKRAEESLLHSVVTLLQEALTQKPRIQRLADTVSGYFSVVILLIAVATFVGWMIFDGTFERALIVAISVIVIACPCALGLATPMATLVGIGVAAKRHILFKEATFLETMARCDTVALDKTGTLTEGKLSVVQTETFEGYDPAMLLALVETSDHPVAKAIAAYLRDQNIAPLAPFTRNKTLQAKGLQATVGGKKLLGGNAALMREHGIACEETSAYTLFYFAVDNRIVARFELDDTIRKGAKATIAALKEMGITPVMLTGDHEQAAKRIAEQLGIDRYYAHLLPDQKARFIEHLRDKGHTVVMAGDGINDAVALAKADIAVAMGSGADIAVEASDVVLLHDTPQSLPDAFRIARRTYRAIKENLALSLLYNLIAVPFAVAGFVTPLVAAASMSLSSLLVVGNSLRIKRLRLNDLVSKPVV